MTLKLSPSHPDRRPGERLEAATVLDVFPTHGGEPAGVINLAGGDPAFETPWHIRDTSIFALERGATSYTANLGLPKLRQALGRYLRLQFGLRYQALAEILVCGGVGHGLDLALRAIVNPGEAVNYFEPAYPSYRPLIELAGGVPVAVPASAGDGFEFRARALEQGIGPKTKAVLLNVPHNPTGQLVSAAELQQMAELAHRHDLVVISDESLAELTFDRPPGSVAALPGMKERTILLKGFSKPWVMSGFRIGYCCAPVELTEAMMKIHQYNLLCVPILSQEAALEALRRSADVDALRAECRRLRNLCCQNLHEMGLPCAAPEAGFYAFPSIRTTGLTSEEFARRLLQEARVAVLPGTAFGPSGEGFIRCNFAQPLPRLREAMSRLARFLES